MNRYRLLALLLILASTGLLGLASGAPTADPDGVPRLVLPPVDTTNELAAYQLAPKDAPLQFAVPVKAAAAPAELGLWDTLPGDLARWRLRIASPGALSLNLGFSRFQMPPGGQLSIATLDGGQVAGPYTAADNEEHGQLWTPLLVGDEVIVEVLLPAAARDQLGLELAQVGHGFLDPFNLPEKSGACNVDVVCAQADLWQNQVDSVVAYSTGGSIFCTGALINNTANDRRPFILTADHCGVNPADAPSFVTYWNFENSTCRTPGSPASGGNGDGPLSQTLSGAFFRADYAASDMTLLELDDPIPLAYDPYWAGWDRSGANATSAVAVHHPSGDEKRISFENDPTTITSYSGTSVPGAGTHIRVIDWDLGTTEPGSSGSPLFDQNGRIIGQLHGGGAACGNDLSDWYGRLFVSWTGGGTSATRLSNWLDPIGSGATTLNGLGPTNFTLAASPASASVCASAGSTAATITVTRQSGSDAVTLAASGQPGGSSVGFSPNPVPGGGSSAVMTIANLAGASPGNYTIGVSGTAASGTAQTSYGLSLAVAAPAAPAPASPANGATGVGIQPTLSWGAVAQAAGYEVQIALDPSFSSTVTITSTSASAIPGTPLISDTTFYWRVRSINGCGPSGFSATSSFTTQVAPGACPAGRAVSTVFSENFSGGPGAWTSGGTGNTWALSTLRSSPASGGNAFRAAGSGTVSDQQLISPPIAIPAAAAATNPTLQFQNYQSLEDLSGGCFDGATLEISPDNGVTWAPVPNEDLLSDPYDGPINAATNPINGRLAWCGDPQDWLNSLVDLSDYAGQTVRFRFRVGTDSSVSREGWFIDDVAVRACVAGSGPAFSSGPPPAVVPVGRLFSHSFSATGSPAPTFGVDGSPLPVWLNLNPLTGLLSGVPPAEGSYGPFTITASNGAGAEASQTITIVVGRPTQLPLTAR